MRMKKEDADGGAWELEICRENHSLLLGVVQRRSLLCFLGEQEGEWSSFQRRAAKVPSEQCCLGTRPNRLKHHGFSLQRVPFILVSSCNFKRLVSAPTGLYRHQTKTPGSYPIGLDSDLDVGGFYEALRAPKRGKPCS